MFSVSLLCVTLLSFLPCLRLHVFIQSQDADHFEFRRELMCSSNLMLPPPQIMFHCFPLNYIPLYSVNRCLYLIITHNQTPNTIICSINDAPIRVCMQTCPLPTRHNIAHNGVWLLRLCVMKSCGSLWGGVCVLWEASLLSGPGVLGCPCLPCGKDTVVEASPRVH